MSAAPVSQVSGVRPVTADGSAADMAETRVAGNSDSTGRAGSLGPNNPSTGAGPTVRAACSTPCLVSVRSAQAAVSSLAQLTPVAYPSKSLTSGVTLLAAALAATATAAG